MKEASKALSSSVLVCGAGGSCFQAKECQIWQIKMKSAELNLNFRRVADALLCKYVLNVTGSIPHKTTNKQTNKLSMQHWHLRALREKIQDGKKNLRVSSRGHPVFSIVT